jgi:drug/metabolite transporter (DMT)-like permease
MQKVDNTASGQLTSTSSDSVQIDIVHSNKHKPKNLPLSKLSLIGILFAVFTWGLSFPMLKIALEVVPPITLGALRYGIAAILLILYLALKRGLDSIIKPLKEDWKFFFVLGLVGITLPNILQNYGMIWTTASLSSIIQSSGPIFTILLAVIFLHEPLGINKVLGTTLALSGAILLVTEGGVKFTGSTFLGNFLILMSALSYSISSIMSKKILEKHGPLTIAILSMVIGTAILAIFSIFESPQEYILQLSLYHWFIVVILALLPGAIALLIWYVVLRTTEVSRLILFIYLIPVFATIISFFWLGEVITISTVFFAFLIVCGVMITQFEKINKRGRTGK